MKKYLLVILSFFFFSINASAETAAEEFSEILANFRGAQGDFEQVTMNARGKVLHKSKGTMALQRPGKFRWNTLQPTQQLLIADGKYIWVYDIDLEQVIRKKQTNNAETAPAMLLSSSTQSLMERFSIKSLNKADGTGQWFQLTPRNKESLYKSVQINFKKGIFHAIRIISNVGQTSTITFYNVVENPRLDDKLFHFSPPSGVDVIRE